MKPYHLQQILLTEPLRTFIVEEGLSWVEQEQTMELGTRQCNTTATRQKEGQMNSLKTPLEVGLGEAPDI